MLVALIGSLIKTNLYSDTDELFKNFYIATSAIPADELINGKNELYNYVFGMKSGFQNVE